VLANISQLKRFLIAGLTLNLFFFSLYLFLSRIVGPYVTISITYPAGIIASYLTNKSWVFRVKSANSSRHLVSYFLTYLSGYVINVFIVYLLSEYFLVSYQIAQLAAICFLAVYLYLMLKYAVFRS
jgi:putative flippase GtrA